LHLGDEGLFRVPIQGAPDTVAHDDAVVAAEQGCLLGQLEGHAEMAPEAQEIGRTLAPFLGPGLVGVVEVTAEEPQFLHASRQRIGNGVGDGGVEEIVSEGGDHGLNREPHRLRVFGIGGTGDDRGGVAAEHVPVGLDPLRLCPQIVHHPELVVAQEVAPEVDRPYFLPGRVAAINANLLPVGEAADAQADDGDDLRARLQAVGWIHGSPAASGHIERLRRR